MINKLLSQIILLLALLAIIGNGCGGDKKAESPETENEKPDQTISETDTTNEMTDTTKLEKEIEKIPDITGTWTGELDNHGSTLRIIEQDSLNFKGRISTNFREVLNQEVSGEFDPETRTLKMRDTHKARSMGTYTAKLSEDLNSMTGTFTITHDKKNFSFNYRKNK